MVERARWRDGHGVVALKAILLTVPLVGAKWLVHELGWESLDAISLLTALLGGVIFTLAILLSGVLVDFKESERLVSELSSGFRRLHAELAVIASAERLAQMRREVCEAASAVTAELRDGRQIRTRRVLAPLERLDALVLEVARLPNAPSSNVRTVQVGMATIVRATDRLETIVETTFLRAGYFFTGAVVAAGLAALTFARLGPLGQALALHAFASFLLVGLVLLIYDLDNPFRGAVRASIHQLEKTEAWLRQEPALVPIVTTAR